MFNLFFIYWLIGILLVMLTESYKGINPIIAWLVVPALWFIGVGIGIYKLFKKKSDS